MRKSLETVVLLLLLGALTFVACIVDDELFGLITMSFWAAAGIAKLLAAHEEYRTSR